MLWAFALALCVSAAAADVRLYPVDPIAEYPDAAAPEALQFACAEDRETLSEWFQSRDKPYRPELVRSARGRGVCHIDYEPSLPGFRADPETFPVRRLIASVDPLPFVIGRNPVGASFDVLRDVAPSIPTSVPIDLLLVREFDERLWPHALSRAFADSDRRRYRLLGLEAAHTFAWAQDLIKSGRVGPETGGQPRVLVPRRVFEGRGSDGPLSLPVLDALQGDEYVRSKLSWEGGDLLIAVSPLDRNRRILIYGGSAAQYWAVESLQPKDYGYVLSREFGADTVVDLSAVGPHADYLVALMPDGKTALVAEPVREDLLLARSAAAELEAFYGAQAPAELRALTRLIRSGADPFQEKALEVRAAIDRLRPIVEAWEPELGADFVRRVAAYVRANCPQQPGACFLGAGKQAMFEADPALARAVADAATYGDLARAAPLRLLDLIEAQAPDAPEWNRKFLDDVATALRGLGFRVVRVPFLVAPERVDEWVGVSYANSAAIDGQLFVPALGLGQAEEKIFAEMARKLPDLQVVPVAARSSLLDNGGVHCILGPVRGVPSAVSRLRTSGPTAVAAAAAPE